MGFDFGNAAAWCTCENEHNHGATSNHSPTHTKCAGTKQPLIWFDNNSQLKQKHLQSELWVGREMAKRMLSGGVAGVLAARTGNSFRELLSTAHDLALGE